MMRLGLMTGLWSLVAAGVNQGPPVTTAHADGKGKIEVHLVYFAEHNCMAISSVTEGNPPSIEPPKRTPTVTVVLDRREGPACQQKLVKLERDITIADRPKALSVEVLYIAKDGTFIRSSRPPISRPGESEDEME